jgi:hypothetical protein
MNCVERNTEAWAIARGVAELEVWDGVEAFKFGSRCKFCGCSHEYPTHAADCLWVRAQQLVAAEAVSNS